MKITNFSPLKDITSNSDSSFEMGKKIFNSITADSQKDTNTKLTKKWMGGNKDSSNYIKTKTIEAIGKVSFDGNLSYHSKNDINFVNNAISRTRAGGAIVPPKFGKSRKIITSYTLPDTPIISKYLNSVTSESISVKLDNRQLNVSYNCYINNILKYSNCTFPLNISGLTSNTLITVTALNSAGESRVSNTLYTLPDAPIISILSNSVTSASISIVLDNPQVGLTYNCYINSELKYSNCTFPLVIQELSGNTSITVSALKFEEESNMSNILYTLPDAPIINNIITHSRSIDIYISNYNNAPNLYYEYSINDEPFISFDEENLFFDKYGKVYYLIPGLNPNTKYSFNVRVTNLFGNAISNYIIRYTLPLFPE